MKTKILALAMIIITVISCSKKNDDISSNSVEGNWKLTGVLDFPGNGSRTFESVISNKILTFSNDGKLSSNGTICNLAIDTYASSATTYSEFNSTINCYNHTIQYELNGNTLILNLGGIEQLKAKYSRVK